MKILKLFLILSFFFISSCSNWFSNQSLTEDDVKNYINVYKELRAKAPEILEVVNQNPKNADIGLEQYKKIENIIKDGGFESYYNFVFVNSKIGLIFSLMQGQKGLSIYANTMTTSDSIFNDMIDMLQQQVDDPNTNTETRIEFKRQIQELKQQRLNNQLLYEKNEKWAKLIFNAAKKIENMYVSESDIKLVEKYEQEIWVTYTGFPVPALPDGKFPEINLDAYK
jgi:hypothetical protein